MAIDPQLKLLYDTTVTVAPVTESSDGFQTPTAGTAISYSAHIERSEELVRTESGQERVSRRKIHLYHTDWTAVNMPTTSSVLTLPATHPPVNPQVMQVQVISDERGIHHVILWC